MQRREFIVKSGMMLSAAAFLSSFTLTNNENSKDKPSGTKSTGNTGKRPDPDQFNQPILKAIAIGVNAPSPHNTQSWKFKITSDTSMLFYVDKEVMLPATDPPSRQIHIGAGCFIETLVIGITKLGYKATITYFPEGYENENDFGIKPVANIQLTAITPEIHVLEPYILKRQTNRRPSSNEQVPQPIFDKLINLSGKSHSDVKFFNKNLNGFKEILYKGLEIESRTKRTNEETRLLFRFTEEERAKKGNGLSMPQMGYRGLILKIVENSVKNGDPQIWHNPSTINKSLKAIKKATESTMAVVVWSTNSNTYTDWLENGRDYVRFSLAATAMGYYLHPYNQATQEYAEMEGLRTRLHKECEIKDHQKIQFVARIGKSSEPYYSYRKNVTDYLI